MEQGAGAVRVMTVHGAKGLEANIVILPDTAQIAEQERRAGLLYTEDCVFFGVNNALNTPAIEAAKAEAATARDARVSPPALCGDDARARMADPDRLRDAQRHRGRNSWHQLIRDARAPSWREERDRRRNRAHDRRGVVRRGRARGLKPRAMQRRSARVSLADGADGARSRASSGRRMRRSAHQPAPVSPIEDDGARFRRGLLIHALLAHLPGVAEAERESRGARLSEARGHRGRRCEGDRRGVLRRSRRSRVRRRCSRRKAAPKWRVTALLPELGNCARQRPDRPAGGDRRRGADRRLQDQPAAALDAGGDAGRSIWRRWRSIARRWRGSIRASESSAR